MERSRPPVEGKLRRKSRLSTAGFIATAMFGFCVARSDATPRATNQVGQPETHLMHPAVIEYPEALDLQGSSSGDMEVYKARLVERLGSGSFMVAVGSNLPDPKAKAEEKEEVMERTQSVENSISESINEGGGNPFEPVYSFAFIPAFIYEISTQEQIDRLLASKADYMQFVDMPAEPLGLNSFQQGVIGLPQAYAMGARGVGWNIGSIDTGIDYKQPAFTRDGKEGGRITESVCAIGPARCPNGRYLDDQTPHAASFVWLGFDNGRHGTATASVATNMSEANIIPVMIYSVSDVAVGLDYFLHQRYPTAAVSISVKWGSASYNGSCANQSPLFRTLFQRLVNFGIAIVPAAGNDGETERLYEPACITIGDPTGDGIINAGATGFINTTDRGIIERVAGYSTRGPRGFVTLLFPADGIFAAVAHGSGYERKAGTSLAAPGIGAQVANERSSNNQLTPAEIERILNEGGDHIPDVYVIGSDRRVVYATARRVNIARSVARQIQGTQYNSNNTICLPFVSNQGGSPAASKVQKRQGVTPTNKKTRRRVAKQQKKLERQVGFIKRKVRKGEVMIFAAA